IWHLYLLLIRNTLGSDTRLRSTPWRLDTVTSRGSRRYGAGRRRAAGVRESRLEETIWDPSTFGLRVYPEVSQDLQDE
ncbi:hypothetical protein Tco_0595777, partial [Tanacetum coccineum]